RDTMCMRPVFHRVVRTLSGTPGKGVSLLIETKARPVPQAADAVIWQTPLGRQRVLGVSVNKFDVARLREPAAWIMLATGGLDILLTLGRLLFGSSGVTTITDRAALYFGSLTSPVIAALLLGAVLLLTKVGTPSPQAKVVSY